MQPTLPEFKKLARQGNIVPVFIDILADLETPVSTFLKLCGKSAYSFLLESVEGGERWGRYSFISWSPRTVLKSSGKKLSVIDLNNGGEKELDALDYYSGLKEFMAEYAPVEVPGLPRFWGGAVGYLSYDAVRLFEDLPGGQKDQLQVPDMMFMISDRMVIFDHLSHAAKIVVCVDTRKEASLETAYRRACADIERIIADLRKPLAASKPKKFAAGRLTSNMTEKEYCARVEQAKEHIFSGDIIQTVLSQRFMRKTAVPGFDIYRSLRLINPSPYMYYVKFGGFEIIGSSPEILVRKEGETAETRPIAGTRPRGKSSAEEEKLSAELLADPKERAEHIMLVDLARNDLGRVCGNNTVQASQLMSIEKYSHVMHLVSSVTGALKPGIGAFDLLQACFPAGTVSGAPKVRAMEIIDELEPAKRGPYAGAVGYFSFNGNMDTAITIRTIVLKDGIAYAQAGAGIVADSVPASEYRESRNKAAALFAAIDHAEKGAD